MSTESPNPGADLEGQPESQKRETEQEKATWWCRILVKIVAGIAVIACSASAITVFITIEPLCIVAGVIMILMSILIVLLEIPFCCQAFETTKSLSKYTTDMKYWQKGLLYCLISIAPVALCPSLSTALGCIVPFATGVIYGLMSLGKKADRSEMLASAGGDVKSYNKFENEAE